MTPPIRQDPAGFDFSAIHFNMTWKHVALFVLWLASTGAYAAETDLSEPDKTSAMPADSESLGAGETPTSRAAIRKKIERETAKTDLPADIAEAVVFVESGYNPATIGAVGEIGLMQMRPETAAMLGFRGNNAELAEPDVSKPGLLGRARIPDQRHEGAHRIQMEARGIALTPSYRDHAQRFKSLISICATAAVALFTFIAIRLVIGFSG